MRLNNSLLAVLVLCSVCIGCGRQPDDGAKSTTKDATVQPAVAVKEAPVAAEPAPAPQPYPVIMEGQAPASASAGDSAQQRQALQEAAQTYQSDIQKGVSALAAEPKAPQLQQSLSEKLKDSDAYREQILNLNRERTRVQP